LIEGEVNDEGSENFHGCFDNRPFPTNWGLVISCEDSHNSFSETISKLEGAIEARNLAIIFDVNHKDVMATVGIEDRNSATIGFIGPMMEHKVLRAEPRAALEMPLKIVVRELDHGEVEVIYYQPSYLFKHYESKNLDKLSREMDILVGSIIKEATQTNG
jgi:uncharacterized protein (DUF302 family)